MVSEKMKMWIVDGRQMMTKAHVVFKAGEVKFQKSGRVHLCPTYKSTRGSQEPVIAHLANSCQQSWSWKKYFTQWLIGRIILHISEIGLFNQEYSIDSFEIFDQLLSCNICCYSHIWILCQTKFSCGYQLCQTAELPVTILEKAIQCLT